MASVSYGDITQALLIARPNALSHEAQMLIDHYVELIRRNLVPDQELIEQCRLLYAKHKDALDLIIRYGEVNVFQTAADSFFKDHADIAWSVTKPNRAAFVPTSIYHAMPDMDGLNWFGQSRPVLIWFFIDEIKLGIVIEVGPFSDEKRPREPLVKQLLELFGSNAKIYPKYTRIFTKYVRLNDEHMGDGDRLRDEMEKLYKGASQHLDPLRNILASYFG